ncbi:MAG: carboxymuconolactone decarboxylase family protein [Leptospiraceae bacterium]|nr:carboxymuconolactone decarboxylase family protein [Leptospiraceae bacterium]
MANVNLVNSVLSQGKKKEMLEEISKTFGATPAMFRAIGNSESALESMWGSFKALGKGKIGAQLGEQIAVAVADVNRCEYCLAAHTKLGIGAGLSPDIMKEAQLGKSNDPKTLAVLDFSVKLTKKKGKVTKEDLDELRKFGYGDDEIAEIIAHVALNIFTNYTNIALGVDVDFPKIPLSNLA